MCLILFSYQQHPEFPLVLAANRDEFYDRPTRQAQFWDEYPDLIAGQDLDQGGTWLGVTRQGRLAAITNIRNPAAMKLSGSSRGELTREFLTGEEPPEDYLKKITGVKERYNGFNLIAGTIDNLYYLSSRSTRPKQLAPGLYGLSNAELDTPWPKVQAGKAALAEILSASSSPSVEAIMQLLTDSCQASDHDLPNTGVGISMERTLSSRFITAQDYGTRSCTLILVNNRGDTLFYERNYSGPGQIITTCKKRFRIQR